MYVELFVQCALFNTNDFIFLMYIDLYHVLSNSMIFEGWHGAVGSAPDSYVVSLEFELQRLILFSNHRKYYMNQYLPNKDYLTVY